MKREDNPKLYDEKVRAIQKVEQAWKEARNEIRGATQETKSFRDSLSVLAKEAAAGLTIAGVFYGITNGIKTAIQKNAELSDSYADVMKTTGLTEESVDRLNEKFKRMDTRTANAQLLELASVAGKLGYSSERDVEGFVRAADKIGVALGEDLGGVEEAVNSLGKLVNIFKVTDDFELEDALLKIGSAINTLGAEGTAAEKNLIDFAQRMAGIAPAANISLPTVLAYGSVMDELGQSMESSSTAIGQFIVGMGSDIPKYAKIAKMSVKDFSDLLLKDANEAFLRVLDASKTAGGGIQALATNMGILEVSGARGIQALGAMSDNIDLVRTRMDTATDSFELGTSVLEEFETKNTNLAANLEKLWNRIDKIWQSTVFRSFLTDITALMGDTRTEVQKLSDEYVANTREMKGMEDQINPLKARYDELKKQTTLNKDEQNELGSIINQIAELLPSAATEWDKYGNAIDINRVKVEQMTFAHKELLQARNEETINDLQKAFKEYSGLADIYTKSANDLQDRIDNSDGGGLLSLLGIDKKGLWEKDMKYATKQTKLAMGEAYDAAVKLREFGIELSPAQKEVIDYFDGVAEAAKKVKDVTDPVDQPTTPKPKPLSKEEQKKAEREAEKQKRLEQQAKEHFARLLKEEELFSAQQLIDQKEKNDREVSQLELNYQKKIEKFEEFKSKEGASKKDKAAADEQIAKLETDRDAAVAALKLKQEKDLAENIAKVREQLSNKMETERQREISRINQHFNQLKKDAGTNEAQLALIEEERAKALTDAKIREEERLAKVKKAIEDETAAHSTNKWQQKINEVQQRYAREIQLLKERNSEEIQESEAFKEVMKAMEINKNIELQQIDQEKWETIKDAAINVAQTIANATFSIISNNIQAESNARLSALQEQRDKELSSKNLTEKRKKEINEKYDKMERAEKLRAWQAQKKADILSAVINTALAVTRALPNFILAGAAGIAGAAQIAVIASQKAPQFAKGGLLPEGSSHAQGGIHLIDSRTKQSVGNIEGGEPILSRNTYANNREVVDQLLYASQRRNGARIQINPDVIDAERAVRNGGFSPIASNATTINNNTSVESSDNGEMLALLRRIAEKDSTIVFSNRLYEDHKAQNMRIEDRANA